MRHAKAAAVIVFGALTALAFFGTGVAVADYTGQTYSQASADISKNNRKPVISTVVGDHLATADCIVTSSKDSGFLDSSGNQSDKSVILSLNCNAAVAKAGTPGNSAATPEGKIAKQMQSNADYFATNPDWCLPSGKYRSSCKTICTKNSSLCTSAMLDALEAKE